MNNILVNGQSLPNIPWEDRKEEGESPIWRYSKNPLTKRNPSKGIARIFNSGVMPFEDGFIGIFRGEKNDGIPLLYLGRSKDGIHFVYDSEPISFVDEKGVQYPPKYSYDPRLVKVEDTYYVM